VEKHLGKYGKMILQKSFDEIFTGKTVFITGHTGFIGTWLSLWMHSMGAKVIGYSLEPPTKPSLFETIELDKYITHIIGDVRDATYLRDCMSKHNPQFVFHLAAQSLVRLSYEKPIETFHTNVMGTANVLESIRNTPSVKVCIIMTSDKCYENRESNYAYKENDPIGGYDPYSASKGATELLTASYRNSFFNPNNTIECKVSIATIRAGNVIGGGDWARDRIVPDCIRALVLKQPVAIHHPNSIRPWQHVLEPILGMLILATKMSKEPSKFSEAWNFGPLISNSKTTVKEIVTQTIDEWGNGEFIDISKQNTDSLHEANLLILDSVKAMNLLGWKPVYSTREAITETIMWYKKYVEKTTNMRDFTLMQIQNYSKKAKQMDTQYSNNS
jgi:CDP-glucose 4,6-dehydratase